MRRLITRLPIVFQGVTEENIKLKEKQVTVYYVIYKEFPVRFQDLAFCMIYENEWKQK